MRVGVYVDGYNVYYGGRSLCGRGTAGWRWLDLRALADTLVANSKGWPDAEVHRIVYCTAQVDAADNPSGHADQQVYLRALLAAHSVDHVEYGYYVSRVKQLPLARKGLSGRPELVRPDWPIMIQVDGHAAADALFMASVYHREEKGSDVNVSTHLLVDVLEQRVDAAIVLSNDSDLSLPVSEARRRVPVGIVNPSASPTAGALQGEKTAGVGRHWWFRMHKTDFTRHQLPDPVGAITRPAGW